jgi:hypothetical protein
MESPKDQKHNEMHIVKKARLRSALGFWYMAYTPKTKYSIKVIKNRSEKISDPYDMASPFIIYLTLFETYNNIITYLDKFKYVFYLTW